MHDVLKSSLASSPARERDSIVGSDAAIRGTGHTSADNVWDSSSSALLAWAFMKSTQARVRDYWLMEQESGAEGKRGEDSIGRRCSRVRGERECKCVREGKSVRESERVCVRLRGIVLWYLMGPVNGIGVQGLQRVVDDDLVGLRR